MGTTCLSLLNKDSHKRTNSIKIDADIIINRSEGTPLDKYQVMQHLGEGSYGRVFLVRHKETNVRRAMKEIKKTLKSNVTNDNDILNEIEILKKLDHPNILKIYEFFCMKDRYFLITEYCIEGELFNKITMFAPFGEKQVAFIMNQVISAIYYCHNCNIIHRDLKPENILVSGQESEGSYEIKIIDFGTAKIFQQNEVEKKVIGSSYYIAPEVLFQNYTEKCDLWSCGVMLYIMLSGHAPFNGNSDSEILTRIKVGKYDLSGGNWKKISQDAKDLIRQLLEHNPIHRPSAKEALDHPFLKKHYSIKISKEKLNFFIKNLRNYKPDYFLQQAALAFIVHNISNYEDIKQLILLFKLLDKNGDGKITKEELFNGMKDLLENENEVLMTELDEIFLIVDANQSGFIKYQDFIVACIDKEKILTDANVSLAFKYFDKNGSGQITIDELREVFFKNTKNNDEVILKELVDEIDSNKDGEISFEEFKTMMNKIFERKN